VHARTIVRAPIAPHQVAVRTMVATATALAAARAALALIVVEAAFAARPGDAEIFAFAAVAVDHHLFGVVDQMAGQLALALAAAFGAATSISSADGGEGRETPPRPPRPGSTSS
jgi:hypothetical protein